MTMRQVTMGKALSARCGGADTEGLGLARPDMSRRGFLAAAFAVLASGSLALTGCGGSGGAAAASASGSAAGLKPVRIGVPGQDGTLTYAAGIAQKLGYLEEELKKVGYAPVYSGFAQAGPAINEAFASGALDIAEYGDLPGYGAIAKGVGIKAFALASSLVPFGIFATEASGVKGVADLAGKRVVVPLGTVTHHYLLETLDAAGISAKDVELMNATYDGPSIINANQADAAAAPLESLYAGYSKARGSVIATSNDAGAFSATYPVYYRTDFHKENPKVAPAIVRALERASKLAGSDAEQAADALVTKAFTRAIVDKTFPNGFAAFDPRITDDAKQKIESLGSFMKENKLSKETIEVSAFFDEQVVKEALG